MDKRIREHLHAMIKEAKTLGVIIHYDQITEHEINIYTQTTWLGVDVTYHETVDIGAPLSDDNLIAVSKAVLTLYDRAKEYV